MSECGSEISNWWVPDLVASPPYSAAQIPLVVELLSNCKKAKREAFCQRKHKKSETQTFLWYIKYQHTLMGRKFGRTPLTPGVESK